MERIFRESGLADVLMPAESLRHAEAVKRTIGVNGDISEREAAPFRTPLVMTWDAGSTSKRRAGRAGSVAILAAHCSTAPSSGDATVTLTMETEASGVETIGTLTIPQGQRMADTTLHVQVPAGGWLGATVTTANGASGVSLALTLEV